MNNLGNPDGNSNPNQKNNLRSSSSSPTVVIDANGAPTIKDEPAQPRSKMPEILKKLDCPEATPVEVSRLISQELAFIASEISLCNAESTGMMKLKVCTARLEAVKALANAAKENQALAKHDELNFDGPKFIFLFDNYSIICGRPLSKQSASVMKTSNSDS